MDSINNAANFGGDAWSELQAFKTRQINRREKLNRHKDLINGITTNQNYHQPSSSTSKNEANNQHRTNTIKSESSSDLFITSPSKVNDVDTKTHDGDSRSKSHQVVITDSQNIDTATESDLDTSAVKHSNNNTVNLEIVECLLLLKLCDVALKLPIDSKSLQRSICRVRGLESTSQSTIENLLEKFAHQELITIEEPSTAIVSKRNQHAGLDNSQHDDEACIYVISADHTKLVEFDKTFGSSDSIRALLVETKSEDLGPEELSLPHESVPIQSVKNSSLSSGGFDELSFKSILEPHRKGLYGVPKSGGSTINGLRKSSHGDDVESLLSLSSTRERESKKLGEELLDLLSKPTAKERNLLDRFRSADGYQVQEFCPKGTKDECRRYTKDLAACSKLHFKKIIADHTEESLGDCSFLNTCFHMDSCKYVHYEVDYDDKQPKQRLNRNSEGSQIMFSSPAKNRTDANNSASSMKAQKNDATQNTPSQLSLTQSASNPFALSPEEQARIDIRNRKRFKTVLYPPQWIQCDLRYFDMSLLGKFSVIMADPPWDIHMELPYGTMSDDEMRKLNIPTLQDEGVIFLWVTGRAMELGRECLSLWGYERCDEIIWVKTNQLQRIIRTGRTGHWLNHGKEHCLVGVKGNPKNINRGLDCDIIVAEVRATSHKPDEIYGIIERLSPGTRKIELFGRAHNVQPNWITLGNQLNGVRLVEPSLIEAFEKLNLPYQTSDNDPSNR